MPDALKGIGLWVDAGYGPAPQSLVKTPEVTLAEGYQGVGNYTTAPQDTRSGAAIAAAYKFPLSGLSVSTETLGLIEPGIGTALPAAAEAIGFQALLTRFLEGLKISGSGTVYSVGNQSWEGGDAGERSLDTGIVAAINPNSNLGFYAGSGGTLFTSYQGAIWDKVHQPRVLTSSFTEGKVSSPDSPYMKAYGDLMVDAALNNISLFQDAFDGGSGNEVGNGVTNVSSNNASPFILVVGGPSISTLQAALADPTLASIAGSALAGDPATLWSLVQGGLTVLPKATSTANVIETVWNQYYVKGRTIGGMYAANEFNGSGGYTQNWASTGGADPSQAVPGYQKDYGLSPVTTDPLHTTGRGVPDVSALSQGNQYYLTPSADMMKQGPEGGTSASTPLWASLGVQLNAIFLDHGLPHLGYMNDLLYIASAIAPATFNDVTLGNNVSSYVAGSGSYLDGGGPVMPTGFGYTAGPGYDLASGLGTPNATLLARALVDIAVAQTAFGTTPDILRATGDGHWTSGTDQSVVYQSTSGHGMAVGLDFGGATSAFVTGASASFAWNSRLAGQSLQRDFEADLVHLFDKQAQGIVGEAQLSAGESVALTIDGASAPAPQASLTSSFGFADFSTSQGAVRLAQPVIVAETVAAQDDQVAVVRLRQNGENSLGVTFYKVDGYDGAIGALHPGDAGYAAAALAAAYRTADGATAIKGAGYGNYGEATLLHVNAGDLVAQFLTNTTTGNTYFAFARANEQVAGQAVVHQWNYGHNVVGWEDTYGGGDRDYNDLVVGIDFTSAHGHGWLS